MAGSEINLGSVVSAVNNNIAENPVKGKDVVVVVGPQGVGKSAFIHQMAGSTLSWGLDDTCEITKSAQGLESIAVAQSETTTPETTKLAVVKPVSKEALYVVDTPAYGNSDSQENLTNSLTLSHTLKEANSIRIVLVLSKEAQLLPTLESLLQQFPILATDISGLLFVTSKNDFTPQKLKELIASEASKTSDISNPVQQCLQLIKQRFSLVDKEEKNKEESEKKKKERENKDNEQCGIIKFNAGFDTVKETVKVEELSTKDMEKKIEKDNNFTLSAEETDHSKHDKLTSKTVGRVGPKIEMMPRRASKERIFEIIKITPAIRAPKTAVKPLVEKQCEQDFQNKVDQEVQEVNKELMQLAAEPTKIEDSEKALVVKIKKLYAICSLTDDFSRLEGITKQIETIKSTIKELGLTVTLFLNKIAELVTTGVLISFSISDVIETVEARVGETATKKLPVKLTKNTICVLAGHTGYVRYKLIDFLQDKSVARGSLGAKQKIESQQPVTLSKEEITWDNSTEALPISTAIVDQVFFVNAPDYNNIDFTQSVCNSLGLGLLCHTVQKMRIVLVLSDEQYQENTKGAWLTSALLPLLQQFPHLQEDASNLMLVVYGKKLTRDLLSKVLSKIVLNEIENKDMQKLISALKKRFSDSSKILRFDPGAHVWQDSNSKPEIMKSIKQTKETEAKQAHAFIEAAHSETIQYYVEQDIRSIKNALTRILGKEEPASSQALEEAYQLIEKKYSALVKLNQWVAGLDIAQAIMKALQEIEDMIAQHRKTLTQYSNTVLKTLDFLRLDERQFDLFFNYQLRVQYLNKCSKKSELDLKDSEEQETQQQHENFEKAVDKLSEKIKQFFELQVILVRNRLYETVLNNRKQPQKEGANYQLTTLPADYRYFTERCDVVCKGTDIQIAELEYCYQHNDKDLNNPEHGFSKESLVKDIEIKKLIDVFNKLIEQLGVVTKGKKKGSIKRIFNWHLEILNEHYSYAEKANDYATAAFIIGQIELLEQKMSMFDMKVGSVSTQKQCLVLRVKENTNVASYQLDLIECFLYFRPGTLKENLNSVQVILLHANDFNILKANLGQMQECEDLKLTLTQALKSISEFIKQYKIKLIKASKELLQESSNAAEVVEQLKLIIDDFWILLSFPDQDSEQHQKDYQELTNAIGTYLQGVLQNFLPKIKNKEQPITPEDFTVMVNFLVSSKELSNENYAKHLPYFADTRNQLLDALIKRIKAHANDLENFTATDYANINRHLFKSAQLQMMVNKMTDAVLGGAEQKKRYLEIANQFDQHIQNLLMSNADFPYKKIILTEAKEITILDTEKLENIWKIATACQQQPHFKSIAGKVLQNLQNQLQKRIQIVNSQAKSLAQAITSLQVNKQLSQTTSVNEKDIVLEEDLQMFLVLQSAQLLQNSLREADLYYKLTRKNDAFWLHTLKTELVDNGIQNFFQKDFIEAIADNNVHFFAQLLEISKNLVEVYSYIDQKIKLLIPLADWHQYFSNLQQDQELMQAIHELLQAYREQNYKLVIEILTNNRALSKGTLTYVLIANYINQQLQDKINEELVSLSIKEIIKNKDFYLKLIEFKKSDFFSKETVVLIDSLCKVEVINTVKHWFSSEERAIIFCINNFKIGEANKKIAEMEKVINLLHEQFIKRENALKSIEVLAKNVKEKITAVVKQSKELNFNKSNFSGLGFDLGVIEQELSQPYSEDWTTIKKNLKHNFVQFTESISNKISESKSALDLQTVCNQIIKAQQFFANLKDSSLAPLVKGELEKLLKALVTRVKAETQEDKKINDVAILLNTKESLIDLVDQVPELKDLENFISNMTGKICQEILQDLEQNKVDEKKFSTIAKFFEKFYGSILAVQEQCKQVQAAISNKIESRFKIIAQVVQSERLDLQALEELLNALTMLLTIKENIKDSRLKTQNFDRQVGELIHQFTALYKKNSEGIGEVRKSFDAHALIAIYEFAKRWEPVTDALIKCEQVKVELLEEKQQEKSKQVTIASFSFKMPFGLANPLAEKAEKDESTVLCLKNNKINIVKSSVSEIFETALLYFKTLDIKEIPKDKQQAHRKEEIEQSIIRRMEFLRIAAEYFLKNDPDYFITDYYQQASKALELYVEELATTGMELLKQEIILDSKWETLHLYYLELAVLAELAPKNQHLLNMGCAKKFDELGFAINGKIEVAVNNLVLNIQAKKEIKELDWDGVYALLLGLKRMSIQLSHFSKSLKEKMGILLEAIKEKFSENGLVALASYLTIEGSGLGKQIIEEQKLLQGYSHRLRNLKTKAVTIDHVLDTMETKRKSDQPRKLENEEKLILKEHYEQFNELYQELLNKYLMPNINFENPEESKVLTQLKQGLSELVNSITRQKNHNGTDFIWSKELKAAIPHMLAYVFVIWTLKDSECYFSSDQRDQDFLKIPHPVQLVAIFRMLNIDGPEEQLQSNFIEVLTGEGKSITAAAVNAVLALIGYDIYSGCYSRSLSKRDESEFHYLFELLDVGNFICYGTLNDIFERVLNKRGELTKMAENVICQQQIHSKPQVQEFRPPLFFIDEADVFFNPNFSLYQPFFYWSNKAIEALIQKIWQLHGNNSDIKFVFIESLHEYKMAYNAIPSDYQFLLEAAVYEMLEDLNGSKYLTRNGHKYEVRNQEVVYPYMDGYDREQIQGYKTLWAAFYEYKRNNVSEDEVTRHMGVIVNCGIFSYLKLTDKNQFIAILGVSGTLKRLAPSQQKTIEQLGIGYQDYMPSAYGANRVQNFVLEQGINVLAAVDEYHQQFLTLIMQARKGTKDPEVLRPILVFFKNTERLQKFKQYVEQHGDPTVKERLMIWDKPSSGNVMEENAAIAKAMEEGRVLLAIEEYRRGRDFVNYNHKVNENGGTVVVDGDFPLDVTELWQSWGRTGRRGELGACYMVLCEIYLIQDYGSECNGLSGVAKKTVFLRLSDIRDKKFKDSHESHFKELEKRSKTCHEDSMQLAKLLQTDTNMLNPEERQERVKKMKLFNQPVVAGAKCYTAIMIDGTGSMSGTINAVKETITLVVDTLKEVLQKYGINTANVLLQLLVYRSYSDGINGALEHGGWTNDSTQLKNFIAGINAYGGDMNHGWESGELGLQFINHQSRYPDYNQYFPPTQLIVIGDAPFTDYPNGDRYRSLYTDAFNQHCLFKDETSKEKELQNIQQAKIPIYARYVSNYDKAVEWFNLMGEKTGGDSKFLNVSNSNEACNNIMALFGESVLKKVSKNEESYSSMLKDYMTRIGRKN